MNLREADRLAKEILAHYGVEHATIGWDNARSRTGVCKFFRRPDGIIRKEIVFSRVAFNVLPEDEQRDTILHEIAHARLPHTEGHSAKWKAMHRAMGGNGRTALNSKEIARAAAKWLGECTESRTVIAHKNRLTDKSRRAVCSCHRKPVRWRQMA